MLKLLQSAERAFGAREPLGDGGVRGQKRAADFRDAESAKGVQRERDLRLGRHERMAADEHHAQAVVRTFLLGMALFALGTRVNVGRFREIGPRPLVLGLASWVLIAAVSYAGVLLAWA